MNENEIRTIVREAIARHLGSRHVAPEPGGKLPIARSFPQVPEPDPTDLRQLPPARHASHVLMSIRGGAELGGNCLIEPAVVCSHCGFCQSYGH